MSCWEEEAGSYLLAVGEYKKFKKAFNQQYGETMTAVAQKIAKEIKSLKDNKSQLIKRDSDYYELIRALRRCNTKGYHSTYISDEDFDALCHHLLHRTKSGVIANVMAKSIKEAKDIQRECVSFHDASNTISWRVRENNHAVRCSRESLEGRLFFSLLSKVKWRGRQGGAIYYTSEYVTEHGPCEPEVHNALGWAQKEEQRKLDALIKRHKRSRG